MRNIKRLIAASLLAFSMSLTTACVFEDVHERHGFYRWHHHDRDWDDRHEHERWDNRR